jgi:ADP-L-glycero-D-manno-heptose 6-epimerase
MASMVHQVWRQIAAGGPARLFEGTDGYADGEQRRDFVHVDDVVDINLHFVQGQTRRAIVNVGSGASRSFNDVGRAVIAATGRGSIEYVPFAERLRGRYQSFTEADLDGLRAAGYQRALTSLEAGVASAVAEWSQGTLDAGAPPALAEARE